jgi:hypothetical protein
MIHSVRPADRRHYTGKLRHGDNLVIDSSTDLRTIPAHSQQRYGHSIVPNLVSARRIAKGRGSCAAKASASRSQIVWGAHRRLASRPTVKFPGSRQDYREQPRIIHKWPIGRMLLEVSLMRRARRFAWACVLFLPTMSFARAPSLVLQTGHTGQVQSL